MATIGKNILENLTTGMYSDSKVMFREYIQNACDQIDKAIDENILNEKDALIDIYIDYDKRNIIIKDNATGAKAQTFRSDLGDIANSNKIRGEDKGFRGIGRLCGLAYCDTLVFRTSYLDESIGSIMTCDAKKMREMLTSNIKYTIDEIWDTIVSYDTFVENPTEHYFEVKLCNIGKAHEKLLDESEIVGYLNFVAPVPYKNTFILRDQIYGFAQTHKCRIDEYCIKVNGKQIFKDYTTRLKEIAGSGVKNYDEISKLEFHEFFNSNGKRIAWMWIGLSGFEKCIPKVNVMRGIRLRSANIQIGGNDRLQELFKESRGNYYFVGEVFAEDKGLVPNSQRDYFNENESRVEFEDALRLYFYDVLHKLYYDANRIKSDYKKQIDYASKVEDYNEKAQNNGFVDENARRKLFEAIEKAQKEAEEAQKRISKLQQMASNSPLIEVHKNIKNKYGSAISDNDKSKLEPVQDEKNSGYIAATFSKLSRSERKLVSRILTIIADIAPKDIAEKIINNIKEELK